ncbi:MAG TPA: hypothetical protein VFM06_10225 [Candidatus Limnocylindria bacterium]|nr:hypothetical protein [Candidatus Limnocylindria bacterium]
MRLSVALTLGAAAGLLAATQPIADTDLFWHLATGRETLAHGPVRTDVFSWTVRGAPVSVDQWLGQLALYGAYAALDWRGIALLRVVAVGALLALVVWNASAGRVRPLAAVVGAVPATALTRPLWVDRPELLGLVCFAALLPLLRAARAGDGRAAGATVLLVALWANVHGSFALGVVLTVAVALEGVLRDRSRARRHALLALAAVGASLLTPAGLATWTAPGYHLLSPPRDIEEWRLIDIATPLGAGYALTLGLVLAAALLGPRLGTRELVVLLPVALLSLTAARQAPLLAIAAAPLLATTAQRAIERVTRARAGSAARGSSVASERRKEGPGRAVALAIPGLLIAAAAAIAPTAPDERAYPVAALTSLPNGDGVLARYEWGGWLIWRAPATPVFIDGRFTPYLGAVLDDYRRVVTAAPGWEETLRRRGVSALLLAPEDPAALRARELGWRVLAASDDAIFIAVP